MNMPPYTRIDFHPDSPKLPPTSTFALLAPPSLVSLTRAPATCTFTGDYRVPASGEFYWSQLAACVRIQKDSLPLELPPGRRHYILKKQCSKASYPTEWRVSVTPKLTLHIPAPPTKEVCAANNVALTSRVSVPIHDRPFATQNGTVVDKMYRGYVPDAYDMRWELARLYKKKPPEEIPMDTPLDTPPVTPPDTGWLRDHYVALTGEFRRPEAYEMYYGFPFPSLCVATYSTPAGSYWILRAAGARDPAPEQKLLGDGYLLTGEVGIPLPGDLYWDWVYLKVSHQGDAQVYSPVWLVRRREPCPELNTYRVPASGEFYWSQDELEDLPLIPELAPTEKVAVHYDDRSDDEKRQEKEWKEYQEYARSLSR